MGKAELAAKDFRKGLDQLAVVMRGIGHTPAYQRSVYIASPQSLMAENVCLAHKSRAMLNQRIKAAIKALGINQAEAARRCGWSAQRLGQYVSGARVPDIESLMRMAEVFGTTPDALLGVSEQPANEIVDILSRLLELEGLDPQSARTIAEAAGVAQQVLRTLPGLPDQDRARIAAQAVWTARQLPKPDKSLDQ